MEKYLTHNGTKLWSVVEGEGMPLILCNGGPGCDDYMKPVSDMVQDLCTIVRFEQRGCGRSDWDKQYDLYTTIEDIDFVREAYGFEKIIIAGHSAGVGFALAYAISRPEAVAGIIGLSGGSIVNDREWSRIYHENLDKYGEDNGGKTYHSDPDVNKMGVVSWRKYIKEPTLLRDLSRLAMPTVFINAGADIRPNWPTVQLAHLLKQAEYVEIPDAGHYTWVTHPDELKQALRAAIKKITAEQH